MATVKNKRKLCETSLSDFSIEHIDGAPFYFRYMEMERVFRKLVPSVDFGQSFAQPVENKSKQIIEWFYYPGNEMLSRLSDLYASDAEAYNSAISKRDLIINTITSAMQTANDNERRFLNAALSGLTESDSTTYFCEDNLLFGVWGMRPKLGRKIEDVLRDDALDHRVFTINYIVEGNGDLSFSSIGRKYGYRLTPNDVPQVSPSDGWTFTKWKPDIPQGLSVSGDATFTAVCEQIEPVVSSAEEPFTQEAPCFVPTNPEPETPSIPPEPDESDCNVHFRCEDGGFLRGKTDFTKNRGERISLDEIPQPIPKDEYVFAGWDHEPNGYEVYADTGFLARFRKKEENEHHGWLWGNGYGQTGCLHALLNWLLMLLGLLLLALLLWCFVFGKCHFNLCGCNCDNPVPTPVVEVDSVPTPVPNPNPEPHTGDVQILLSWSNNNDLDLACIDPFGEKVWYKNKNVTSGGKLDIDMNRESPYRSDPIENIYWPAGLAPKGQYTVILTFFSKHEDGISETSYAIKVKHGEKTDVYTGTIKEHESITICTFELE